MGVPAARRGRLVTSERELAEAGVGIRTFRGRQVLLDEDLAVLYGVPVKALNQATKRNRERFPPDFMFRLTALEHSALRSQSVTLVGRGRHRKYAPYAFTEQGVAMLSSVLRSKRAIQVNIEIMRAFVRLRAMGHGGLKRAIGFTSPQTS